MKQILFILFLLTTCILTNNVEAQSKAKSKTTKQKKQEKKLVYLFTANGGMVGYYDDGSVVGCPRCDFCRSNILAMLKEKPMGKWDLKKPDDFISYEDDKGWVLINYKWKEKVPQF